MTAKNLELSVTREFQSLDMMKIADTLVVWFTKILFPEHQTITCVYLNRLIGKVAVIKNVIYAISTAFNSIVNFRVEIQILHYRVSENQYDLYMRVDSNTNGHRQWYYFSMKNQKKGRIKLHIYRFKKVYSLYQRGMKPYVKSRRAGGDWTPGGDNIIYHYERQRNEYGVKKQVKSFILTFSYNFQHDNDEVFIAAGVPYTYTFLQRQLQSYQTQLSKRQNINFQITNLCKSMCGLELQLITVQHKMARLVHSGKMKKYIIINARTHSGQTSSSWVLDGLLMELANCPLFQEWILNQNICMKIIPMLNPDGVFIGNYRTGIIGDDFNRKFNSGRKQFYPQIFALKRVVSLCKKDGIVQLFLDLHGHSILKNSFIYGPSENDLESFKMKNLCYHLFHNSKYFRLASCKFKTQKENIETARVYFQLKEEILTFTCENSLGLYFHQRQTFQMLAGDWQTFGQSILQSMRDSFTNKEGSILHQHSQSKNKGQKHSQQKSPKPNAMHQIQKKIGSQQINKFQLHKGQKHQKIHFKLPPPMNYSPEKLPKNSVSFSQQINRQDQLFEAKQFSYLQKKQKESQNEGKLSFKIRRKSQVMKIPTNNIIQRAMNKIKRQQSCKVNSSMEEDRAQLCFIRSSTYDNSQTLARQIQNLNKTDTCSPELYPQYDMEVVDQNFSDQYCSINDSDSDGDNLPQQERNYIFQYIKFNQQKQNIAENDQEEERSDSEKEKSRSRHSREPKISRFRQIRFKSIEQLYQQEEKEYPYGKKDSKKIKLQPHKFKDNTSKSLINRFNQILNNTQFDDPSMLPISQQKKLNERERVNQYRRTQKDPFVLIQRKEKTADRNNDKQTNQ